VWGAPGGLGWGKPMRWGSARELIEISDSVVSIVQKREINFPVLVVHDPEDKVTQFSGSLMLFESATSAHKSLSRLEGGKHDLMTNEPEKLVKLIHDWVEKLSS
jgi:esterase/lipase